MLHRALEALLGCKIYIKKKRNRKRWDVWHSNFQDPANIGILTNIMFQRTVCQDIAVVSHLGLIYWLLASKNCRCIYMFRDLWKSRMLHFLRILRTLQCRRCQHLSPESLPGQCGNQWWSRRVEFLRSVSQAFEDEFCFVETCFQGGLSIRLHMQKALK